MNNALCYESWLSTAYQISKLALKLRKKCPYSELFWSVFSRIRTGYREILRISPYLVQMREKTDQNNSEYGHFSHTVKLRTRSSLLFAYDLMRLCTYSCNIGSAKKRKKQYRITKII